MIVSGLYFIYGAPFGMNTELDDNTQAKFTFLFF